MSILALSMMFHKLILHPQTWLKAKGAQILSVLLHSLHRHWYPRPRLWLPIIPISNRDRRPRFLHRVSHSRIHRIVVRSLPRHQRLPVRWTPGFLSHTRHSRMAAIGPHEQPQDILGRNRSLYPQTCSILPTHKVSNFLNHSYRCQVCSRCNNLVMDSCMDHCPRRRCCQLILTINEPILGSMAPATYNPRWNTCPVIMHIRRRT